MLGDWSLPRHADKGPVAPLCTGHSGDLVARDPSGDASPGGRRLCIKGGVSVGRCPAPFL